MSHVDTWISGSYLRPDPSEEFKAFHNSMFPRFDQINPSQQFRFVAKSTADFEKVWFSAVLLGSEVF